MRGHNPLDEQRQKREDPMAAFVHTNNDDGRTTRDRIVMNEPPRKNGSPIRGGFESDDPNQQLLSSDNEAEEEEDKELRYVRGLSEQERVALLKKLKKQEKEAKKRKKDRKRRRKEKKERKNAQARTQASDAAAAATSSRTR